MGLGAGIGLAVGGAAWFALAVCVPAAMSLYISSSDSDFLTYRVMKENLCGERSEENKILKGFRKRIEQEMAPIKAAKAEAAKIKMEIIHLDSRGGIEICTDKTVQVRPAADFAKISKDFNLFSTMNDTKVGRLADGSFVVYTDDPVKVKPPAVN